MHAPRLALVLAAAPLALTGAGACTDDPDGVLAIAFALGPPPPGEHRVLPPESELGAPPRVLGLASGRCDVDVVAATATCSVAGLPTPPRPPSGVRVYRLHLLLHDHAIHAGFDARGIGYDPGGHDPDHPPPELPPPPEAVELGVVTPDPLGLATLTVSRLALPLDRVIGAEVRLHVPPPPPPDDPDDPTPPAPDSYVVLDGRVGNLADGTEPYRPQPDGGGHHH